MPADALWAFAMALNVYLTFFHKFDSSQLRKLEWKYFVACYGIPFVPAFIYCFVDTPAKGKIYGEAVVSVIHRILAVLVCLINRCVAMVLGFSQMGCLANCHFLWPCLVHFGVDIRNLYPCRQSHFREAAAAAEREHEYYRLKLLYR